MEKIRPTIVGDIQMTSEGEISIAANSVMRPSSVCARWRRAMLPSGIEPSSRRCGFQPVSRPDRICATDPDWISIMIARERGRDDDLDDRRGDERQRAAGAAARLRLDERDR